MMMLTTMHLLLQLLHPLLKLQSSTRAGCCNPNNFQETFNKGLAV
jgi:hypothetical protein